MADTRINALSTATSSVSDDFVPIDGATNGTRKLSAYSPTFGGNATVGGTLTVSGSSNSTVAGNVVGSKAILATGNIGSPGSTGLTAFIDVDTGNSVSRVGSYNFTTSAWSELQINGGGGNVKVGNPSSVLTVNGTTASTTTSSGALVVSGGVGVAGAIYAGGVINTTNAITASQTITGNDLVATAGYVEIKGFGGASGTGVVFLGASANNNFINGSSTAMNFYISNTSRFTVDASNVTIASGTALKLGNAYTAGAPTATGYIVIKDSSGTSYKIPAQAL